MGSVRLLTAALLSVAGIVAVGVTSESASANSLVLNASRSSVMKYEHFYLSGKLITPKTRTVKLQYKSGDSWIDKASKLTVPDGSFEFDTYTGGSRTYRYYAPRSGTSATIIGAAKTISVVSQKVTYFAVSPDYQCATYSDDVVMLAQFYPVRRYRQVAFQTNAGTKYGYEDGNGIAKVTFDPGTLPFTYNATATADAYYGAAAKTSSTRTYSQDYSTCV